jgi:hypothetical protein
MTKTPIYDERNFTQLAVEFKALTASILRLFDLCHLCTTPEIRVFADKILHNIKRYQWNRCEYVKVRFSFYITDL